MSKLPKFLKQKKIIRALTSAKIATVCLSLLFILTFCGTVYQIKYGLYPAQERFFNSFFFLIFNVIPFPGAHLVMWVLFVNLLSVLFFRFQYTLKNLGILVIHIGIMTLLLSGFLTLQFAHESNLSLFEAEGSNVTSSYHDWELAIWKEGSARNDVVAVDATALKIGKMYNFEEFGLTVFVKSFYANSQPFSSDAGPIEKVINDSGIKYLEKISSSLDPTKNSPGGVFAVHDKNGTEFPVLLYGPENISTQLVLDGAWYHFQLRHKKFILPFVIKLIDFRMQKHPGTEVAKSFESTVEIETPQMTREAVISMNNPLRYQDYTFYQASYAIDPAKGEMSSLAVVRNTGRILPYVATIVTFLGLMLHFVMRFVTALKRERALK